MPYCELFTLTLTLGDVLAYTDWEADVVIGGTRFIGSGLVIPQRGNLKSKVGTEVDEMQLDLLLGQDDNGNWANVLRGMTMQMLAAAGWLDQATVLVQRLFWEFPQRIGAILQYPPWGPVWKFSGAVSKPGDQPYAGLARLPSADRQKLQRQVPNRSCSPAVRTRSSMALRTESRNLRRELRGRRGRHAGPAAVAAALPRRTDGSTKAM